MSEQDALNLIGKVLQAGSITSDQIRELDQELNSDWVVDQDEIGMLFEINKTIGANDEECPEWTEFFVRNVTRLVVMDMYTPGEIDKEEGDWLGDVFEKHRANNETEAKLIHEIKETTSSVDGKFQNFV